MDVGNSYLSQISTNILDQKSKVDMEILAGKASNANNNDKIKAAAQDFEAVFITQMIQHMFSGVEVNELFGGGHGEETFRTLLFDEYGKTIAKAGGVGVAQHVQRELLALQEVR